MKRTACYGTCPQYTISIYDNGVIRYEGKMFVEKTGCFYGTISSNIIKDLRLQLNNIQFFSLNNEYNAPMTDVPSVILEANVFGKTHKVIDRFNGPEELKTFQHFIDSVSESVKQWNKCKNSE